MAAGPTYQENQVIMISPTSTHPAFTSIGDFVFRTCTIITDEFRFTMDILANDLQARNVAVVAIKTDWGNTAGNIAAELIRNDPRLNLVIHEEVMETSNDYGPEIAKIRAAGADTVFMIGMYSFYGPFVRQFREVDPSIKLAAVANAYTRQIIELGGVAATEGIIMPVSFYSESDNPIIREFVEEFRKRFGMGPSSMAAQAYDAVGIMLQATKDAGTLNRARLRDAVHNISYPGVTGLITFNEHGDAFKVFQKVVIRNGSFVPLR
jgi:branched-chain amino acid transport system substrate-binding protein